MECEKCKIKFDKRNQQGGYINNKWFCNKHIINQPERSKREDLCLTQLADLYIEEWEYIASNFAHMEDAYIQGVYDFSDWLKNKMRCSEH